MLGYNIVMSTIDEYLSHVTPSQKHILEHIRAHIHQQFPEAKETISYGMPVFKLDGRYLIGIAAFKAHLSLFPGSEPIAELTKALANYPCSKGTIQFTEDNPISDDLLETILQSCYTHNMRK